MPNKGGAAAERVDSGVNKYFYNMGRLTQLSTKRWTLIKAVKNSLFF
jgi:hypothetical protein